MHISASVRYTVKKPPKDYDGMIWETWNFGKDEPLSLPTLSYFLVQGLAEFWARAHPETTDAEMSEMMDVAGDLITRITFGPKPEALATPVSEDKGR